MTEWARNGVHVLMKAYATCVDGRQEAAKKRIENALKDEDQESGDQGGS